MTREPASAVPALRSKGVSGTLKEAFVVGLAGLVLALLANGISPRGLSLRRDYFPAAPPVRAVPSVPPATGPGTSTTTTTTTGAGTGSASVTVADAGTVGVAVPGGAAAAGVPAAGTAGVGAAIPIPAPAGSGAAHLAERLAARGLRLVGTAEARRLFEDPRRVQELVVFVDARNEAHYEEGHVPGAYLFDRYYPENHLPTVIPACQTAEQVVVYCLGGECEDSELAAAALVEAGIPAGRVGVFGGGMTEWTAAGMPVELGARGSGRMREGAK